MLTKDPPLSPPSEPTRKGELTRLLEDWANGDADALDRLFPMVLDELRAMARGALAREGDFQFLQPTELVSEVCLKLLKQRAFQWESRSQFFAFSSMLMRRILVDHARKRRTDKRDAVKVSILDDLVADEKGPEILALDDALKDLEALDPLQARIVEMRIFGGWTIPQIAAALDVGTTTVKRRWSSALLWLRRHLSQK